MQVNDTAELKALKHQRRLADQRVQALATMSGYTTWIAAPNGAFTEVSTWCSYTGQHPEEATGEGAFDAVHPDDRAAARALWRQAIATESPLDATWRLRHHDGLYRTVAARARPIRDPDDAVCEWLGACVDVTEQHPEHESAAQVRDLHAIFDAIADSILVYGLDGHLVFANAATHAAIPWIHEAPTLATFIERSIPTMPRDSDGRSLPPERWPLLRALRGETLTEAETVDMFVRRENGQEHLLNVSAAPMRDSEGRISGAVIVNRNVTVRQRLERRTHQALAALLEMAHALVGTRNGDDGDGIADETQMVGQRLVELARQVLGCERATIVTIDTLTGRRTPIAVVGLSPEQERVFWERAAQRQAPDGDDVALLQLLRDGQVIVFDITRPPWSERPNPLGLSQALVAPMRIGQNLIGILAFDYGRDVHLYDEAEIELATATGQLVALVVERERLLRTRAEAEASELALQEANRRMDEFLAIAAHELKTPLTGLKGFVQLTQRRLARAHESLERGDTPTALLEAVQGLLVQTNEQITRLERLTADLVDVSRIESGQLQLNAAPCNLMTIVDNAVQEQRLIAPEREITVTLPSTVPLSVYADADRIHQVVTNYLTNALKYSDPATPIVVGLTVADNQARVWVRDQGVGITESEHASIWERFYRTSNTALRSGTGVGLGMGLFICRTIIDRHGGEVGLESSPGHGSTFWFTLPLLATP